LRGGGDFSVELLSAKAKGELFEVAFERRLHLVALPVSEPIAA
jgi:hypothetical protein